MWSLRLSAIRNSWQTQELGGNGVATDSHAVWHVLLIMGNIQPGRVASEGLESPTVIGQTDCVLPAVGAANKARR